MYLGSQLLKHLPIVAALFAAGFALKYLLDKAVALLPYPS